MEHLIEDICQKTGIDRSTAQKVASYMQANVTRIPQLLQGGDGGGGLKGAASNLAGKVGDAVRR